MLWGAVKRQPSEQPIGVGRRHTDLPRLRGVRAAYALCQMTERVRSLAQCERAAPVRAAEHTLLLILPSGGVNG
ncbi:hypothetical protein PGTUg99_023431 [Puccinia graminis f. sp. tritici]|uniref:Uncharacterized protein n=1 Tax=Puccinia graminis f. sp. tritici TaxID=56615 RepID=A0A5B0NK21_PUCGR|nr:hypothetical protein PGTUg99_023431 [Puccinia graminis f. sp. tritici]